MHKFLAEGEQTKISSDLKELAASIEGDGLVYIFNLLVWIRSNFNHGKNDAESVGEKKLEVLMARTADEIYKSNYHAGCTDYTILFVTITRYKGIPTKYVEVIAREWLEEKDPNKLKPIRGHSFGECYVNGEWFSVDPTNGIINVYKAYRNYVIYDKGKDPIDLGIHGYDSMKEKFLDFRLKYLEKHKLIG
jgi:hypothetical protein